MEEEKELATPETLSLHEVMCLIFYNANINIK